jgi:hypothetical protein
MQDVKPGGCTNTPPHAKERKQIDRRCKDAPPGDVCADSVPQSKPSFTATDTMQKECPECKAASK